MTEKAESLLRKSIAHWGRLAAGKRQSGEGVGWFDCARCQEYFEPTPRTARCEGCPVFVKTNRTCCQATPYGKARRVALYGQGYDSPLFFAAAEKELEFLRSLLQKPETK